MLYFCVHLSNDGRLQSFAAACSSPLWPLRAAEGQQETELRHSSLQLPQHGALPGAWGGSASHQQWTVSGVFRLCCWPPWEPWKPCCCCDAVATDRLAQKPAWVPGYVCCLKTAELLDSFLHTGWIQSHTSHSHAKENTGDQSTDRTALTLFLHSNTVHSDMVEVPLSSRGSF